jgi:squalene-hopene/tetraprenyl-beta-curcumene cyclase
MPLCLVGLGVVLSLATSFGHGQEATAADGLQGYLRARGIEYVPRDQWLPKDAPAHPWPGTDWRKWGDPNKLYDPVRGISLHCPSPWVVECDHPSEKTQTEKEIAVIQRVWEDHRTKWPDIGYHYLVFPSGRIYEGRAGGLRYNGPTIESIEGAHTIAYNEGYIGLAFVPTGYPRRPNNTCDGCFYEEKPTQDAITTAVHLITWIFAQNGIDPMGSKEDKNLHHGRVYTIAGHRDFWIKNTGTNNKDCPGDQFYGGRRQIQGGTSHPYPEPCNTVFCLLRERVAAELDALRPTSRALHWLRGSQREDHSWSGSTGITALVLLAFLNAGVTPDDADVRAGLAYLVAPQRLDRETGRFGGDVSGDTNYYAYNTALGILALVAAEDRGRPRSEYRDIIAKARDYLLSIQYGNPDNPNDPQTGGWGYPRADWTDLSNTQWVVMALDAAYDYLGEAKPPPADANAWTGRLLRYLDQCQNPDGGFGYRPGLPSWGSMSAAGLWSLVLAGVDVSDARVADVLKWISANYRLDVNPGGRQLAGLYYYYVTLAKALTMADHWALTTPDGRKHDWNEDLRAELEKRQSTEDATAGSWVNSDASAWENNRDLCTAYAVLALQVRELPSSDKQLSWVLTLHSPAELHLYGWLGSHVGRNEKTGGIDTEIPGSSYSVGQRGEQIITLTAPQAGRYRIEVVGTGTGSFTLTSKGYLGERTVSSEQLTGTISTGQVKAATATLTSMVGPLTVYIGDLRNVPHGLVAVPGKGVVDLSWGSYREDGFDLTGYAVYRSTTSRVGYARISVVPGTQTTYRDTNVVAGTTYYYVITAIGSDDEETPFSREASAAPLGTFPGSIAVGPNPVGADGCAFFYILPDGVRRAVVLIFDVTGRKVAEISLDPTAARYPATGRWYPVNVHGVPLANGPYVYVLVADDRIVGQGKMVIQR